MNAAAGKKRLAMLRMAIGLCMYGVATIAAAASLSIAPSSDPATVSRIADRWLPVASQLRTDAAVWRAQFSAMLSLASPHTLSEIDAMTAKSDNDGTMLDKYQRALKMATLDAGARLGTSNAASTRKLGSTTSDLVFTPITPCRVVDTRVSSPVSGPIATGTQRNFYFYSDGTPSSWMTSQGGNPGTAVAACPGSVLTSGGGTLGSTPPAAAMANIAAVNTTAAGNFIAWGGSVGTIPITSVLNWDHAGEIISNTTVVPWGGRTGGNLDFTIRYNGPSGASDVVVDIMGYFSENAATALNCQTAQQSASVPIGVTVSSVATTCTAGFTATGGGCSATGTLSVAVVLASNPTVNGWNCTFLQGLIGYTGTAYANCCQVPGQ